MANQASAYLALATMMALRNISAALPSTRYELSIVLEKRYPGIYENRGADEVVDWAVRQLESWDLITIIKDKYAGETLRLYGAKTDEALSDVSALGNQELVTKARVGGVDWFNRVFSNEQFWRDVQDDPPAEIADEETATGPAEEFVPASDRIVSRSDNRVQLEVIQSDMRGLTDEIETNNEISVELGDEKEIIKGELSAADTLLDQPSFRFSRLTSLVLPALQFLADKFAAGAIGEMAKRIISAIIGLI